MQLAQQGRSKIPVRPASLPGLSSGLISIGYAGTEAGNYSFINSAFHNPTLLLAIIIYLQPMSRLFLDSVIWGLRTKRTVRMQHLHPHSVSRRKGGLFRGENH